MTDNPGAGPMVGPSEIPAPQRRFPLEYAVLLACLIGLGAVLAALFLRSEFNSAENHEKALLTRASDDAAVSLQAWIRTTHKQSEGISQFPVMTEAATSRDPVVLRHAADILDRILAPFTYEAIYVLGEDGSVRVHTNNAPEFPAWLASRALSLTDGKAFTCFEPGRNPGYPRVAFAHPLWDSAGSFHKLGTLVIVTRPDAASAVVETAPDSRVRSIVFARHPEGYVTYFSRMNHISGGKPGEWRDDLAEAALTGAHSFMVRRTADGLSQYAVSNYVQELGWGIITREWRHIVLEQFYWTVLWTVVVFVTLSALSVTMAYALWRHQQLGALRGEITQKELYEAQLRQSEECFNTAFRCAPEGMSLSRMDDGRFLEVNQRFAEIFGYKAEEIVGHTSLELNLWADPADRRWVTNELRAGRSVIGKRIEVNTSDGRRLISELSAAAVKIHDAEHIVISVQDITPKLLLQEQLRQAQKMEAVGLLAGTVAHDFNNLLMAISSQAELLQIAAERGSIQKYVHRILAATESAAQLTRKLLAFGRKQELASTTFDLNEFCADVTDLIQGLLPKTIKLEYRQAPEPCWVRTDRGQMEQTLINLVLNARDAMHSTGKIILSTSRAIIAHGEVVLHAGVPEGDWALLTVADTGCGIPAENLERIFEPFFTTKPKERGTGLGLSMVYGIVRQSGGHLRVRSALDAGTTFSIYLPLVGGPELQPRAEDSALRAETSRVQEGTVLVVDDEEPIRVSVKHFLERNGLTVVTCADGAEALRTGIELGDRLALLVTDVVMPGMSGTELAAALAARLPNLPIIFMSGYAAGESGEHSFSRSRFLQKPFSRAGLINAVWQSFDS